MNEILHQEAKMLMDVYNDLPNYTFGFLILKRFVTLVEIVELKSFDKDFRHIYRSVIGLLEYPPGHEDAESHLPLLQRELNYLIPHIEVYLRKAE